MLTQKFKLTAIAVLCLPGALFNAAALAEQDIDTSTGPVTRVIIKYKETNTDTMLQSLPATIAQQRKAERLQAKAERFSQRAGEKIKFVRKTALEKHAVFSAERRLSAAETETLLNQLSQDDDVELVEEDMLLQPTLAPNDTQYANQWHYYENTGGIRAPAAWDNATGQGVVVAVLDTGYRPHVDLNANLLPGYDMISDAFIGNDGNARDSDARDPGDWTNVGECGGGQPTSFRASSWHGTHVAGTVAAVSNNNTGVAGVAFNAKVVPVRVLGKCGGYTSDIADGIIWASGGTVSGVPANANPASVINMSLGGSGSCNSTTQNAINQARSRGTVIVVAAGNDNGNANNFNPGNCTGVVNVASTNRQGGRAYYSNTGSSVDVAAPGGAMSSSNDPSGVLSTYNSGSTTPANDSYGYSQGTSMAAPHVAGIAALIKQAKPNATPDQIEDILKTSARSFPAACSGCGVGLVDANAAVLAAQGTGSGATGSSSTLPNLSASRNNWLHYTIDIPAGMQNFTASIAGGTGDADLYVRRGARPTTSSFDCRPYLQGNNETCSISNPAAATWHISIRAYSTFSGVTLNVSYNP
ncbi:S8 family serine peptidase [Alishewanella sp. 16-MA]|uniref:S8 family serine peptidase n=1 Tax=Alishewanella maricola TaxID=2795740 RepID=A0ABS8C6E4_9ALTE|nr:S8 family peptidase [Alishewanella maricola]MCB5227911.1 S8 family serine peptidase [Alishewanella maricola]